MSRAMVCQSPRRVFSSWKRGTGILATLGCLVRKLDDDHALLLPGFPEANRQRRTGIADKIRTAHRLRDMKMAQGKVIDGFRKDIRSDLREGADIQFAHAVAVNGLAAGREEMPHGDNRHGLFQRARFSSAASYTIR